MVVLGGGPLPSRDQARHECVTVADLWWGPLKKKGWILAAVEDTVSIRLERPELRYVTLQPGDVRAAAAAVESRFRVDPSRVHLAGLSLGANYAVQFAAAQPDAFAGVVAVVSEGESREHVLRNLAHVGLYALNGGKDKNVRSVEGPRKMGEIARKLGLRARFVEEAERGHEGFAHRYEAALDELSGTRRDPWPKTVTRVPHEGLFPVARRLYWVEADSAQAVLRAEAKGRTLEVVAARARRLKLRLNDSLLDLDQPFTVLVNGRKVFEGKVDRALAPLLESAARDRHVAAAAVLEVDVPLDAPSREVAGRWLASLAPTVEPAALPWWEYYARATLREQRPRVDWAGEPLPEAELAPLNLASGLGAIRLMKLDASSPEAKAGLKVGDVLLGFEDEVFYRDGPGLALVNDGLLRLPELPVSYSLTVVREGLPRRLQVLTK